MGQSNVERYYWSHYSAANTDDGKVSSIRQLCLYYKQQNDVAKGDSTARLALEIINAQNEKETRIKAYEIYFDYISSFQEFPDAAASADEMLHLATECNENECLSKAHAARALVFNSAGDTAKALSESSSAYYFASQVRDDMPLRINAQLQLGDMQNRNNYTKDAYHSYIDALHFADSIKDAGLMNKCYKHLAFFFYLIKDYELAVSYRKKQIDLIKVSTDDSDQIMDIKAEIARSLIHTELLKKAEDELKSIIQYAHQHGNRPLSDEAFATYRTMLIEHNEIKRLREIYMTTYKEEYDIIKQKNKPLYFRLQAFFKEDENDTVAAHCYYDSSEKVIPDGSAMRSNFYSRYGAFLLRAKDTTAALIRLQSAYSYAVKANLLPFILKTTEVMEFVFRLRQRWDSAYHYSLVNKTAMQQWAAAKDLDAITVREEEHTRQAMEEAFQKRLKEESVSLQYTAIILAIIISFMLLAIFNAITVPRSLLRAASFISFLFLFECINMLIEHSMEKREHTLEHLPLFSLGLKLTVAAILIPFHHWVEEKAIHYLSSHRLINIAKFSVRLPRLKGNGSRQQGKV